MNFQYLPSFLKKIFCKRNAKLEGRVDFGPRACDVTRSCVRIRGPFYSKGQAMSQRSSAVTIFGGLNLVFGLLLIFMLRP